MNNKQKSILKEIMIMIILSVIIIGFVKYILSNDKEPLETILEIYFFIAKVYAIFLTIRILMTLELKNKIAIAIAIVAVTIIAIPSKNNSYTECGVGSVYTKHYNGYRESRSEGCEVTKGGAIKLTGAFILFFYLSLLLLERREKENEIKTKSKKVKKEADEEIQTKIDDSFNNTFDDNDYKDIPF